MGLLALSVLSFGIASCVSDPPEPLAAADAHTPASGNLSPESSTALLSRQLDYHTVELLNSTVHVITVPANSDFRIGVIASETLALLPVQAEQVGAKAAINAGFFDPKNGLTTSFVTVNGAIAADPRNNDRLIGNPDLEAYLPAILNRSEFRIYRCAERQQYDIVFHSAAVPTNCILEAAVGAGPQLLPTMTGYEEGFMADNAAGNRVRDVLGSQTANARSAVGLKADGTVVLAMASQLAIADVPTGATLSEMADVLASLDVVKALNLDGGSSSGLYVEGKTYFGRLDNAGVTIQRPIKSMLYVY